MLRKNSASSYENCDAQNDNCDVYRYSRQEMLTMKNVPLSRIRPQYLSTEFDNDDGNFEPEKWLEYRWVCEGVESRPNTNIKRKEKLKVEALESDTTVLSPQRRGFSSGCRATLPAKNEAETERLGATKASWRSGAGFQLKNSGTEYKTSFHKNIGNSEFPFIRTRQPNGTVTSSTGNWRSGETSFKPNYQKESGQNQRGKPTEMTAEEKMPEWLSDGPTSMHDMIELRGFDDDNKIRRDFSQKLKKNPARMAQQSEISGTSELNEIITNKKIDATDWRPSSQIVSSDLGLSSFGKSNASHNEGNDDDISTNLIQSFTINDNSLTPVSLLNNRLPNSDAEFAAIMGILDDADLDSLKENEFKSPAAKEPTGSRLSRFFATTKSENSDNLFASRNESSQQRCTLPSSSSVSDSSPTPASISVLNKIFSNTCQRSAHSQNLPEQHVASSMQGVLRVEDLERNFQKESIPGNLSILSAGIDGSGNLLASEQLPSNSRQPYLSQTIKGNPLGDPHQQAHLMNKLNKFARLQNGTTDDVSRITEDSFTFSSKISLAPAHHLSGTSLNSQASSHAVVPPPFSDVTFHAAFLRSQYEKAAALHALAVNQRSTLASNTQGVDSTVLRQALTNIVGNGAIPQSTQARPVTATTPIHSRTSATSALPNSFMPTSVMRQMTKNNNTTMTMEEKLRHSNMSICSTQYNAIKQNLVPEHFNVSHKLSGDAVVGGIASKNAANLMTTLALQQQYAQVLAAMQNGLSLNNWQSNAQMTTSVRAQALAAQAEHQRQYALAMMRGDLNQAQIIRARFLSQQAAAFAALPNVSVAPHPHHMGTPLVPMQPVVTTTAAVSMPQNTQPPSSLTQYKYQNPLEKLLQSAGVPANRDLQPPNKEVYQGLSSQTQATTTTSDLPSIISRLPPTANCISVEELEKQFATN
ncbi:Translational repressor [Dirofilaria immitis]